jgi:hypothetical protein
MLHLSLCFLVLFGWRSFCRVWRYRRVHRLETEKEKQFLSTEEAIRILKMTAELEDPLIFKMAAAIGFLMVGFQQCLTRHKDNEGMSVHRLQPLQTFQVCSHLRNTSLHRAVDGAYRSTLLLDLL